MKLASVLHIGLLLLGEVSSDPLGQVDKVLWQLATSDRYLTPRRHLPVVQVKETWVLQSRNKQSVSPHCFPHRFAHSQVPKETCSAPSSYTANEWPLANGMPISALGA
ncbi:hypothetical protein E2C01_035913 [Portunus trituberculatus]|uniref:Uncharacterized protein n=1 Tax=Portunus trituberculatus TaxID=210409 RepID=A0A5B7FCR3_PORTR|nr:hypothetical protein [Portunus trituberculatus]